LTVGYSKSRSGTGVTRFAAIYAVRIGADLWGIHAFQKKSKTGIKTPKAAIDLIRERLKRLKEMLQ
jgi:phage-related protein